MSTETLTKVGLEAFISAPGKGFEFKEVAVNAPTDHDVLIKIEACGVCHSDSFAMHGSFPGLNYPIVPGHEIVGIVEAVGARVGRLKVGDRVGVGWHGGHCSTCQSCRSGDFITCAKLETPGITKNGGYAQYGIFPEHACASVPAGMDPAIAAPLLCAGVTTFNALRNSGAVGGDTVAVLGLGGLGHLGVQFAAKMGFRTVAIARGDEKAEFAKSLGASVYINSEKEDVPKRLMEMGGAKVALATVTNSKAMSVLVDGLCIGGKLLIVGADMESLDVSPIKLIGGRRSITGWPSGTAKDSEECMEFAALTGIKPMIEKFKLKDATAAYERMISGKARFRVVIETT